MKPQEIKHKLHTGRKARLREDLKSQGFYDGRFRNKVVQDKKRNENKYRSRKPFNLNDL